eukprot:6070192-Karenia_brevis.AAC.1
MIVPLGRQPEPRTSKNLWGGSSWLQMLRSVLAGLVELAGLAGMVGLAKLQYIFDIHPRYFLKSVAIHFLVPSTILLMVAAPQVYPIC